MFSDNKTKPVLPATFQKYFWDVAFDDLSFEKYPGFIDFYPAPGIQKWLQYKIIFTFE